MRFVTTIVTVGDDVRRFPGEITDDEHAALVAALPCEVEVVEGPADQPETIRDFVTRVAAPTN